MKTLLKLFTLLALVSGPVMAMGGGDEAGAAAAGEETVGSGVRLATQDEIRASSAVGPATQSPAIQSKVLKASEYSLEPELVIGVNLNRFPGVPSIEEFSEKNVIEAIRAGLSPSKERLAKYGERDTRFVYTYLFLKNGYEGVMEELLVEFSELAESDPEAFKEKAVQRLREEFTDRSLSKLDKFYNANAIPLVIGDAEIPFRLEYVGDRGPLKDEGIAKEKWPLSQFARIAVKFCESDDVVGVFAVKDLISRVVRNDITLREASKDAINQFSREISCDADSSAERCLAPLYNGSFGEDEFNKIFKKTFSINFKNRYGSFLHKKINLLDFFAEANQHVVECIGARDFKPGFANLAPAKLFHDYIYDFENYFYEHPLTKNEILDAIRQNYVALGDIPAEVFQPLKFFEGALAVPFKMVYAGFEWQEDAKESWPEKQIARFVVRNKKSQDVLAVYNFIRI